MNTGHKVIRYIALAFAVGIICSIISVGYHVVNIIGGYNEYLRVFGR